MVVRLASSSRSIYYREEESLHHFYLGNSSTNVLTPGNWVCDLGTIDLCVSFGPLSTTAMSGRLHCINILLMDLLDMLKGSFAFGMHKFHVYIILIREANTLNA